MEYQYCKSFETNTLNSYTLIVTESLANSKYELTQEKITEECLRKVIFFPVSVPAQTWQSPIWPKQTQGKRFLTI
jgi:hypothetical protein